MSSVRISPAEIQNYHTDANGVMHVSAIARAVGILPYRSDAGFRYEFVPPEMIFGGKEDGTPHLVDLVDKPTTNEHPLTLLENAPLLRDSAEVGKVGKLIRIYDDGRAQVELEVFDSATQEAIASGAKKGVSVGYRCNVVKQDGFYNGRRYTHVQQPPFKVDHVAIVEHPRCDRAMISSYRFDAADADDVAWVDDSPSVNEAVQQLQKTFQDTAAKKISKDSAATTRYQVTFPDGTPFHVDSQELAKRINQTFSHSTGEEPVATFSKADSAADLINALREHYDKGKGCPGPGNCTGGSKIRAKQETKALGNLGKNSGKNAERIKQLRESQAKKAGAEKVQGKKLGNELMNIRETQGKYTPEYQSAERKLGRLETNRQARESVLGAAGKAPEVAGRKADLKQSLARKNAESKVKEKALEKESMNLRMTEGKYSPASKAVNKKLSEMGAARDIRTRVLGKKDSEDLETLFDYLRGDAMTIPITIGEGDAAQTFNLDSAELDDLIASLARTDEEDEDASDEEDYNSDAGMPPALKAALEKKKGKKVMEDEEMDPEEEEPDMDKDDSLGDLITLVQEQQRRIDALTAENASLNRIADRADSVNMDDLLNKLLTDRSDAIASVQETFDSLRPYLPEDYKLDAAELMRYSIDDIQSVGKQIKIDAIAEMDEEAEVGLDSDDAVIDSLLGTLQRYHRKDSIELQRQILQTPARSDAKKGAMPEVAPMKPLTFGKKK